MKRTLLTFLLFAAITVCQAATSSVGAISQREGTVSMTIPGGTLEITPLTADIIRVTSLPTGKTGIPKSQSAVLTPQLPPKELVMTSTPGTLTIATPTTTMRVDRKTGQISFYNDRGELLLSEAGGIQNGNAKRRSITFSYPRTQQQFYGAGERGHSLCLNGDTLTMYNRQNYGYTYSDPRISQMGISVPYFASSRGYSVLIDDFTKARLIMGDPIEYTAEDAIGPLSYYFINGHGSLAGTTTRYAQLTGAQPLPPLWTLGYITSKYGYGNQRETLGVIDTLKRRGYPVDGIVLDLYWYGVETDMGRLEWDRTKWPDPRQMLADLHKDGVHLVAITQPYINKKGAIDNYNYLTQHGMTVRDAEGNNHDVTTWVGDAGMFDVSNPETRQWYWNRYKALTEDGIDGWWGDLGEPEVHPSTIRHHNGMTAEQYHNVYGNEWSRIIYEGMRREFPDRRPMLMMRGGTAGLQRYGVFPWTTDVSRSWGGLQPQVKLMLSSGLSGLGYMSSDIGGFAVDPAHPTDAELYARWLQMGAFTPMLRTHAQQLPEPYHYPEVEKISKKYIDMRYRFLPYNYTLAFENAAKGYPLARPLNFHGDNPGDKYACLDDEYLWGDNLLVAPVMTQGARSRSVTFPAGDWIDLDNTRLSYRGGTTATVRAPLDRLPLFVRAGAFLPQYTLPLHNTGEYDLSHLTVQYFPSTEKSEYVLFDDDRKSPDTVSTDSYILTTFTGQATAVGTVINISTDKNPDVYDWMPSARTITMELMCQKRAPKAVTLATGEAAATTLPRTDWKYDAAARTLTVKLTYTGRPLRLNVN